MNATLEKVIIDNLRLSYESAGYKFIAEPTILELPPFLHGFRPDAIAFGASKNVIIEIASQSKKTKERNFGRFSNDFERKLPDGWELKIVLMPEDAPDDLLPASDEVVDKQISSFRQLSESGQELAGMLLGWATLEAIGRRLLPEGLSRPQTPARLVSMLAQQGYILPVEADLLREIARDRNKAMHGELDIEVHPEKMRQFLAVLDAVRRHLDRPRAAE